MKRVLFVVTNVDTIPGAGTPTGVWLSGVAHPYYDLLQAGYEVHIASPRGGRAPIDPFSNPSSERNIARDDIVTQGFLAAPQHGERLARTMTLASVDPREYRALLICGGNGALFDLPGHPDIERIARTLWETGRVIAAISHGVAGLLDVRLSDGTPLLSGHTVTAVSHEDQLIAEHLVGRRYYPFSFEEALPARAGATYTKANAYMPHVVASGGGRLLTGQNHNSADALASRIALALTSRGEVAGVKTEAQYEPATGLLSALNQYFHNDYEELVGITRMSLEQEGRPVLIHIGNDLILHRNGRREQVQVIPPLYHSLKAVGHMLFGVYLSLMVREPGGLTESELLEIEQQHNLINTVLAHLEAQPFPDAVRAGQRVLLEAASKILADTRRARTVDLAAVRAFTRAMGKEMSANTVGAQRAQLRLLHEKACAWLDLMDDEERRRLFVVVCGSKQARYQEIGMTYFRHLLGEFTTTGTHGEDRLMYIEGQFEEDNALDLIARHIIDQDAGDAFFGDRFRLQRDLLGDGADDFVKGLLASHPFAPR
jgi:putative intracellular protease/amidase